MRLALAMLLALVAGCKDSASSKRRPRPDAERYRAPPLPPDAMPEPRECDPAQRTACVEDKVVACLRDGWFGVEIETCEHGCRRGVCAKPCEAQGVELVYVVDTDNHLMSFDPLKLPDDPFKLVGTLDCERTSTPFSMAIDRAGVAWVRYQSGNIYKVSILDAHCSKPVPIAGGDHGAFGMGFATDGADLASEKLYVATNDALAHLDTTDEPLRWNAIGAIDAAAPDGLGPELTGTGDGRLYGYFAKPGRGFVQELDRASGKVLGPRLTIPGDEEIGAFAFAHWGGVFYVFTTTSDRVRSTVHGVNRKTGKSELVRDNLPSRIVGAGVSTCAPELEAK